MIKVVCIKEAPHLQIGNVYEAIEKVYNYYEEDSALCQGEFSIYYDIYYFIPSVNRRYDSSLFKTLSEWRDEQINSILYD